VRAPEWLTARPIAHRGLHDRARGIIENMPAAAQAAVSGNFSIECDIQLTADGEAMVHHDDALGRLTEGTGALLGMTSGQLRAVKFRDTSERMMSLGDLCGLVAGRVPLVIEVKSHFDGDRKLVTRMSDVLASYSGPVAGMSFDPDQMLALREKMPALPRGIIAQRTYDEADWPEATLAQRQSMLHLRLAFRTQPHFVAYRVDDLPAPAPWIARNVFGLPLLTWTVRTPEQRETATRYADQMIFEGFLPGT
jgi:glycerophosphoryl diester phosphodiesterase